MRNFTMIEKIGAVHLIKSYGGESRKYLKVSRIKYLLLPKCGTKYQKVSKMWDQVPKSGSEY